jgi:hypothetical protein
MLFTHNRTGVQYRTLFKAFDTERQCPSIVYMQLTTGAIFVRDEKDFDQKFTPLGDPQKNIIPHDAGAHDLFSAYIRSVQKLTASNMTRYKHALQILSENGWPTVRAVPESRREAFLEAVEKLEPINPVVGEE